MRRWGVIITAFYFLAVIGLLGPGLYWLAELYKHPDAKSLYQLVTSWQWWLMVGVLVAGEALLLFLSVDTSWRRRRPRQHLAVTVIFVGLAVGLLAFLASWTLLVGIYGDSDPPPWASSMLLALPLGLWAVWAALFYCYYRSSPRAVAAAVASLLAGSVLELLIAVPTHLVVRRRHECTAPVVTSFGIVTGIAIMLLSFGPGVLALYKKRLDAYERPK